MKILFSRIETLPHFKGFWITQNSKGLPNIYARDRLGNIEIDFLTKDRAKVIEQIGKGDSIRFEWEVDLKDKRDKIRLKNQLEMEKMNLEAKILLIRTKRLRNDYIQRKMEK